MELNKLLVKKILADAMAYEWSLQGLGMLRLTLSKEWRLHVWSAEHAVPHVSTLHDHPWDFESHIIAGRLVNRRFLMAETVSSDGQLWMTGTIQCGVGGGLKKQHSAIRLVEQVTEIYKQGDSYKQRASEIHESIPDSGTVTAIHRTFKADTEHAKVFWPIGTEWVSAEPRRATLDEVRDITSVALKLWF